MATSVATSGFGTLLKVGDGGVGAGAKASVEWGTSNQKIRLKWGTAGTVGNGKNITVVVSGSSYVYTTVSESAISITVPTTATVAQVIANLYQQSNFDLYWDGDFGATPGDGSGTITARTVTPTAGATAGTEVFTAISEVKNIEGGFGGSLDVTEVTHMTSPNEYREYIASLKDGDEISFDVNWLHDAAQASLLTDRENRTRRNFQLLFETAGGNVQSTFAAFVTQIGPSFQMEEAIGATISLKVTGPFTIVEL